MSGVAVDGAGVGTLTAARLLGAGVEAAERRVPPALVLNEVTIGLLRDLWGADVLDGARPITVRRVRWGPGADEVAVPITSAVIDGQVLIERLRVPSTTVDSPQWVIDGHHRDGVSFGRRTVLQADVALAAGVAPSTVWIETTDDGWVHLAPVTASRGAVQCMVPASPAEPATVLARMLAATRSIAAAVATVVGPVTVFPAAPRLAHPLARPGWLAVGDGAVRVDPVSGSGTAWSLRSAVLAAAVVRAVSSGEREADCLGHYADRLRVALLAHVDECVRLYSAAFSSPAWQREIAAMTGMLACERARHPAPDFSLRLTGLRLSRTPATR